MTERRLRTGIIGTGGFARQHARRLAAIDEVRLTAFCNRTLERAVEYNQEFSGGQGQVFDDYEQMYEQAELDLVYICLPPYAHGREVALACERGIHFLIEKPIALDMALAKSMAAQVQASGVKAQVGFHYRHGAAVQRLKQAMQALPPGQPVFMTARYACNSLHADWWRDREKSGGQLVEQVIHLVDLARHFLGEAVQVYSVQDNLFHGSVPGYTVEDASATIIRFRSGSLAAINATNGAIPNRWEYDWRLVMPGLVADFDNPNRAVFHQTDQTPVASEPVAAETDLYLAETLDLLSAIRDDRPTAVPIEEGLRSLELVLAARSSAETGVPVILD